MMIKLIVGDMVVDVSVIIPVYNAENFLTDCLESIINQTLSDIEIICIDDGSTDGSRDILNNYAKNDDRFLIISQENKGQGAARNKGLEYINSDYFCFMDADDILELNTLETCFNKVKKDDLDCVMYKLINYDDVSKKRFTSPAYDMYYIARFAENKIFNYKDLDELIFYVSVSPVNKLYNSKFILDNNIRFPEGTIFEDNLFFWKMLFSARRIAFIDEYFYVRRVHSNSTVGFGNDAWCDAIDIYNGVWDIFKDFGEFSNFKTTLYNNKVHFALFRYDNIMEDYKNVFFNHWKDDLSNIIKFYPDFYHSLNEENKRICEYVLSSDNSQDFSLLINLFRLSNKFLKLESKHQRLHTNYYKLVDENDELKQVNKKLNENNKKLSKFKNNVLSSKSWKVTKPLRAITNFLRKIFNRS